MLKTKSKKHTMSYKNNNNTQKKIQLPKMVEPDMDNGLESVSCELAKVFYQNHSRELHRMKDRNQIRRFYVDTVGKWASSREGPGARHFNQVLYALCRDGRVCRLANEGKTILWKFNIPKQKLLKNADRLAKENRELKERLSHFEHDNGSMSPRCLTPPDSPLSDHDYDQISPERPTLMRQSTMGYEEGEEVQLHLPARRMDENVDVSVN